MAIPTYEDIMLPLLRLAAEAKGESTIGDLLPKIGQHFRLTPNEMEMVVPSGRQTLISNRSHWAKQYLSRAGLLESTRWGYFRITDRGRKVVADAPSHIDNEYLLRIPEFAAWKAAATGDKEKPVGSQEPQSEPTASTTPLEQIESASDLIRRELEAEVHKRLRGISPKQFEQVVVDLLVAMGYGGGDPDMGQAVGRSGDGGIDGVIREDSLGLDAVYIQAKRFDQVTVGRPDLQRFIGSLTGEGASKGVFVTTSSFSKEARDYISKVTHRVVLIDGAELARLMVHYNVGVREAQKILLKKIDEDYFIE